MILRQAPSAGLLAFTAIAAALGRAEVAFEAIRLNDLTAGLTVKLQWSWHAIGMDPAENVYVVFGGPDGESADCALFQYQPATGKRRLIGTLSAAAKAAGTWRKGERIEKDIPTCRGWTAVSTSGRWDFTMRQR